MGVVRTKILSAPMSLTFGDAEFEQAVTLNVGNQAIKNVQHWPRLSTVIEANLITTSVSSNVMAALRRMPQLKKISFYRAQFADNALAPLRNSKIESLNLERSNATDADLEHIGTIKTLKSLWLGGYGTNITDAGIRHLSELTSLEELRLNRTKITNAGLDSLQELTKLKTLCLSRRRSISTNDASRPCIHLTAMVCLRFPA